MDVRLIAMGCDGVLGGCCHSGGPRRPIQEASDKASEWFKRYCATSELDVDSLVDFVANLVWLHAAVKPLIRPFTPPPRLLFAGAEKKAPQTKNVRYALKRPYSYCSGPIRRRTRGYIPMTDQSDAGSVGIFP
eukprot:1181429-Prorocentrum_minimum.AAC.2